MNAVCRRTGSLESGSLGMTAQSIQLTTLDVDALRTRLRNMSDEELRKFGKAARYMVSPTANMGKAPLPAFVLQLEEARAEVAQETR